jgi:hypothetical protein
VLRDSGGRPAGCLFGRLFLQPGKPLAGRQVVLSPTQTTAKSNSMNPSPVPSPVVLKSALDGSFEGNLAFDGPVGLDVEVHNADGTLDEFIDVSTLAKPCYVEFASEQSAVTNRLRSNQSDGPDPVAVASQKLASADAPRAKLLTLFTAISPSSDLTIFTNGLLSVDPQTMVNTYNFPDISDSPVGNSVTSNRISVSEASASWFADKTVQVYSAATGVGGSYQFTSQDGQVHSLSWPNGQSYSETLSGGGGLFGIAGGSSTITIQIPVDPAWYKVSYTSSLPNINRIRCQSL